MAVLIKNILLVEDNSASRDLMREAFGAAAFKGNLHITENAVQFFQFLRKEGPFVSAPFPDLILLDLNLPGKNGIEILSELKKEREFQKIPIVVLTGSSASADIAACAEFHCKYLIKPSRFHELVRLVQSLPDFC